MMLEIGLATFAPDEVDRLTNQPWCHSLHAAVDPSECLVVSRAETGFGRVNTEHSVEAAWHLRCLSLIPEQSQDIRSQCRPGGSQDMTSCPAARQPNPGGSAPDDPDEATTQILRPWLGAGDVPASSSNSLVECLSTAAALENAEVVAGRRHLARLMSCDSCGSDDDADLLCN